MNWLVTTLAAVFGTAALSPITAAGHTGKPWQEGLVTAGFLSVGLAITACSLLLPWGLRAKALQWTLSRAVGQLGVINRRFRGKTA